MSALPSLPDALPRSATAILETRRGELCVVAPNGIVNVFDGARFATIRPPASAAAEGPSSGSRVPMLARDGEWWIPVGAALHRFPALESIGALARARPS